MGAIPSSQLLLLFLTTEALFAAGAVLMALITGRQERRVRKTSWLKYGTFFVIIHMVVISIMVRKLPFLVLFFTVSLMAVFEVVRTTVTSRLIIRRTGMALAFILLFGGVQWTFIRFILKTSSVTIITVFILVAILDAFSQLTGQLLGRHGLAPKISPNKTTEGLIGGLAVCIITTVILRNNLSLTVLQSVLFGLLLGVAGSAGDLTSSFFKRQNDIKDYGSILPGQGGVMDRFVSFFAAANAALLYFYLNRVPF